jgi:hypothetical protein
MGQRQTDSNNYITMWWKCARFNSDRFGKVECYFYNQNDVTSHRKCKVDSFVEILQICHQTEYFNIKVSFYDICLVKPLTITMWWTH